MEENVRKDIEEIRKSIGQEKIVISRVPVKTKVWFLDLANEEFCGDYGMCLKHLHDAYVGLIGSGVEHLELGVLDLDRRLSVLEDKGKDVKEEKRSRLAPKEE